MKNKKVYNIIATLMMVLTLFLASCSCSTKGANKNEQYPNISNIEISADIVTQTNKNVKVSIVSKVNTSYNIAYSFDAENWSIYNDPFDVTQNCIVYARYTKNGINSDYVNYEISNIDKVLPTLIINSFATTNSINFNLSASKDNCKIYYKINDAEFIETNEILSLENLVQNTKYKFTFKVVDEIGNFNETIRSVSTELVPSLSTADYMLSNTELTNHDIYLEVNKKPDFETQFSYDNLTFNKYVSPIVISENKTIFVRYVDSTNQAGQSIAIIVTNIDKSAPIISSISVTGYTTNSITVKVDAEHNFNLSYGYALNDIENYDFTNTNTYTFNNLVQGTNYKLKVKLIDDVESYVVDGILQTTLLVPNYEVNDIVVTDAINNKPIIELRNSEANKNFGIEYSFDNETYFNYTSDINTDYNKKLFVRYKDSTNQFSKVYAEKSVELTFSYLTIGNSFSADSMRMIPNVAKELGYKNFELGYLYAAGRGIDEHITSYNNKAHDYDFYKYNSTRNAWEKFELYSLEDAVKICDWNVIIFQQRSADSGRVETYDNLSDLVNIVDNIKTNKNCRFAFNMTWAYQDGGNAGFPHYYGGTQMGMYDAIVSSVQSAVATIDKIKTIIPVGTTLQNMRTSYIGDTLCQGDDKHMTLDAAKIAASATYIKALSGVSIDSLKYNSAFFETPEKYFDIIKESANNSINKPYGVTISKFLTDDAEEDINEDGIDMNKYVQLNLEYIPYTAWNSIAQYPTASLVPNPESPTNAKFMATNSFNANLMPKGTRIILQGKVTVRFEGWIDATTKNTNDTRPANFSNYNDRKQEIIVDETFIGNFTIRAINLSTSEELTESLLAILSTRVRIYVPIAK